LCIAFRSPVTNASARVIAKQLESMRDHLELSGFLSTVRFTIEEPVFSLSDFIDLFAMFWGQLSAQRLFYGQSELVLGGIATDTPRAPAGMRAVFCEIDLNARNGDGN
jgi:hypothetical protein